MHELDPRVEAEVGGHDGRGEVAGDLGGERRADRRLVAQHRADHARVPARVGLEVVLDLADVALEARAQREQPRHLLGEELRRVRLGAVDAGGAADHDRADRRRLLAGGEQLERADHVDVVHGPAGHPRPGPAHDLVVHHGVHLLPAGSASAITGSRMSASMKSAPSTGWAGRRLSSPATCSNSGSASRRRASAEPMKLPTPVIRTRRPATTSSSLALALAGRRFSIASRRRRDLAQLGLDLLHVLLGRGQPVLDRRAHVRRCG